MPAAALAFAAAAAAPGSATAPLSGLSHGVSTRQGGSGLGRGLRLRGVMEGEAVLRALGRVAPVWVTPNSKPSRVWKRGLAPEEEALGSRQGPACAAGNVAGAKMAVGLGGGGCGVSHWRAGTGRPGRPRPYLDVRIRHLPLLAG